MIFSLNASAGYGWLNRHLGIAGGTGGDYFTEKLPTDEEICGLYINHGSRIFGLQMEICDRNGYRFKGKQHGKNTGTRSYFKLNSDEQIVLMRASTGIRNGNRRVFGLDFGTSTGRYSGFYGTSGDNYFKIKYDGKIQFARGPMLRSFSVPEGYSISGFTGREDGEIDAIGVHYRVDTHSDFSAAGSWAIGVAGGIGGLDFPSQDMDNLCKIDIRHGSRIDALQFSYCDGTKGEHLGGQGGSKSTFTLQAGEYLTAIHGHIVKRGSGSIRISSISFVTNLGRTSPTYGKKTNTPFYIQAPEHGYKISNIRGRAENEIDYLDVLFRPR